MACRSLSFWEEVWRGAVGSRFKRKLHDGIQVHTALLKSNIFETGQVPAVAVSIVVRHSFGAFEENRPKMTSSFQKEIS